MGLFGKKKYNKNVSRDNEFLKEYAVRCNGLLIYAEDNEKLQRELNQLRDDFQYSVASVDPKAKKLEKDIKQKFEELANLMQQPSFDADQAILIIREIRRFITEITALR